MVFECVIWFEDIIPKSVMIPVMIATVIASLIAVPFVLKRINPCPILAPSAYKSHGESCHDHER